MEDTNNQQIKSRRNQLNERLSSKYPDLDLNDDEAVSGRIFDDYDEYDGQLNDYKEREQKMVDMMSADPRSANFLSNWHNGENPAIGLMRMFGPELKDALDDPQLQDKLDDAQKEYLERVAKSKELEEQYASNIEQSHAERDAFQQENGLSDAEMDQIWDLLQRVFDDAIVGKFTRESMGMALKAVKHDEDVAAAADDAEVKGRNAKISETLRQRQEGDGTASLNGKNGRGTHPSVPSMGALDRFADNEDIWSRGGERRKVNNV